MPVDIHTPEALAVFIARIFLGLLFFFQGFDAVFRIRVKGVIEEIREPLAQKGVPGFFITTGAWFTSWAELVGGILLVFGWLKSYAFCLLGADLIMASVAFGIIKPMWDMQFAFPRLALLLFLLVTPAGWDIYSLDHLIRNLN